MDAGKIRKGNNILMNNEPYIVVDCVFRQQPRLVAKMSLKLRNLLTGATLDRTLNGTTNIEIADVEYTEAQYLYQNGDDYVFMEKDTYEQFEFSKEKIGGDSVANLLTGDLTVNIIKFNGKPINISLPPTVTLKVTQSAPGIKGDTATNTFKSVTVESGATIQVPLFIKEGDKILINTETGAYKERVK